MEAHGHRPLIAFDTDDPQFARGFEAGRLWTLLREQPDELEEYARGENAEMVLRIAEATGRSVQSEELEDGWLLVRFSEQLERNDDSG
jgi:hypothetical protein